MRAELSTSVVKFIRFLYKVDMKSFSTITLHYSVTRQKYSLTVTLFFINRIAVAGWMSMFTIVSSAPGNMSSGSVSGDLDSSL